MQIMRLASPTVATPPSPWQPPLPVTLAGARLGIERAMATAAVAAFSPRSSTVARLVSAAAQAQRAAATLAAVPPDGDVKDVAGAIEAARAGVVALTEAARLLEVANAGGDHGPLDPYAAVSAAAYDAYDALRVAYLAAGGS